MYGFYEKKLEQDPGLDRSLSFLWKKGRYVTSECENYLSPIQDQELPTKYLRYKRVLEKGNILNHTINVDCVCLDRGYRAHFSWLPYNVAKIPSSFETG